MKFATASIATIATLLCTANAFTTYGNTHSGNAKVAQRKLKASSSDHVSQFDPLNLSQAEGDSNAKRSVTSWMIPMTVALVPEVSNAAGPDWGLFEGKTGSLLHPIMMFAMAAFSVQTALLGFQWRRQRTLGEEISALKKQVPSYEESSLSEAVAAAKEAGDNSRVSQLQSAMALESQISELTSERKDLAAKAPRDSHFNQGALLAFLGTAFAIEGPLNTYARAGKLFPGPHLYAGAGLVVCWALASAMVPSMQKGNDVARGVHIGANFLGLGLFGWQVVSGVPILLKVWEKTQWP